MLFSIQIIGYSLLLLITLFFWTLIEMISIQNKICRNEE
ncbi:MAG: hypothetical protein RLZZ455_165 [Candidatus Parcubacteria bacterium]|jgi:hypothetical protein